jgi:uncharacterized membrane protein
VAGSVGSWKFILIQAVWILFWLPLNLWLLGRHPFDQFPFPVQAWLMSAEYSLVFPFLLFADSLELEKDRHLLEHQIDHDELMLQEIRRNTELTISLLSEVKRNTELTNRILEMQS